MPINGKVKYIYDTLKGGGGDVGTEDEFNDWFFAKGEQGYKHRLSVYKTLTEGGADAGANYEEFRDWLGLKAVQPSKPVTQQPTQQVQSQPKPQQQPQQKGTPMTEAARRKMSQNVESVIGKSRYGSQQALNKLRYTQGNTGLDTKTVSLGQNRKVVSGTPTFNPNTGKIEERYITETGNEFESRGQADLVQNQTDEYNEYRNRTVDSELREAYSERDRLLREIRERSKDYDTGNNVIAPAGSVNVRALRMRNDDDIAALQTAYNKTLERITTLEAERDDDGGTQFWRGFTDAATADTWLMGIPSLQNSSQLLKAKRKMERGEQLTPSERTMLEDVVKTNDVAGRYGKNRGKMYEYGAMTMHSLPFMLQFISLGGGLGLATGAARKGGEMLSKLATNAISKWILKQTGRVVGSVAGATAEGSVMANTIGAAGTTADIMQRYIGDVTIDENGNYKFDGGKTLPRAIYEGEVANSLEYGSEVLGGPMDKALGKIAGKMGLSKLTKLYERLGSSTIGRAAKKILDKMQVQSLPGEMLEEEAGMFGKAALGVDNNFSIDPNSKDFKQSVFNLENHLDVVFGIGLSMGMTQAAVTTGVGGAVGIGKISDKVAYRRTKHAVDKADALASFRMTEDKWKPLRDLIDATPNTEMKNLGARIVADENLHYEEKRAALEYMGQLSRLRGFNLGMEAKARQEIQDAEQSESKGVDIPDNLIVNEPIIEMSEEDIANDNYSAGYDADLQGRRDIAIGLSMSPNDTMAQAAWEGVRKRIEDDADTNVAVDRERARQIEFKDENGNPDGSIRTATLRETDEGGNGRQVYIVAGNVAMTSDGTAVDTSASDKTISIFDPSTGEPRMIDPSEIEALGSVTSAEQYDADIEQKRQDYIQQQIDEAQGTVQIVPGGNVTLPTGEEALVLGTMDADGENVLVQVGDQRDVVKRSDIQQAADDRAIEDYRQRHGIQEDESTQEEGMQNGAPTEYTNGMEIVIREQDGDYGTFGEKTGLVLRRVRAEMRNGRIEYVPDAEGNLIEYLVGDEVRHDHIADLNNMIVRHSSDVQGETESGSPASLAGIRRERTQDRQQQDEYEPAEEYETPIGGEVSEDEYEPAELPEYGYDEGNYERVMPMVGEGEDAEPDFLATTPQRGHRYLYEEARLPRKVADNIVSANLSAADKELKKQKKAIDTLDSNPGTSIAQYQKKRRDLEDKLNSAQATHDYWQAVRDEQDKVVAAEAAERARQESALHEQASEDERRRQEQELAKRREQEERGANAVHPAIREKWDNAPKVEGAENEITLANGEKVKGRYMLVESGAVTPSHNPNAEFARNEGFPVDENGQTVNDRDYERDKDAQNITRQMAAQYDSRAIQSVPVVSRDGIVLSGNGRTMAGELAAQNNTDGAYIGHLLKYPQQFGFTTEQVQAMTHPRVVFVPDEAMPYTTDTFAKFNQQDMKSQSRTEQSVKLGKTVDDSIFNRIIQSINTFDSISDFYNDAQASTNAIAELRNAGVINAMQYAEMFDGEKVSMTGRQMLENMLVGKAFESNPDAIRQLAEYPSMRQSVISALAEISNNVALGEDYSLEGELAQAINLAYQARKSGYKAGDVVSNYARQLNLFPFDEGETVADYTNAAVLMLADVLNDSRTGMLKKTLALYNREAADSAAGQIDMFSGGVKTKQQILKEVLNILNYATENQQRTALAAAAEQRKADAAAGQGGGGEGVQPNGTTGESGTEGEAINNDGIFEKPDVEFERIRSLRQALADGYANNDKEAIQKAVDGLKKYVDEGLDSDNTYSEEIDDYEGNDPMLLAERYITHLYQDRYLDDDEDQEYINTGIRSIVPAEQPKSTDEAVSAAEQETDTNPTEAQKEAGNYKKGHVKIDGFDVTIENPKGSKRSGTDKDGNRWEVTMNNTYGYIRGTEGVDGDHIDVFLSDNMDGWNGTVYVVDQINADGTFDEHKVMYGFNSAEEAAEAYNSNYSDGWQGLGAITGVSKDEFIKWVDSSHRKTKPFAEYKSVKTEEGQSEQQPVNVEEEPTATSGNGYTITPTTYTTKKGKELAMQLVTFDNDLTKEQKRAADKLAREKKGWFDRAKNGYMMRSEADAEELAKLIGNDAAVQEAQPVSLADIRNVTDEAESRPQEQTETAAEQPKETPQPEQKEDVSEQETASSEQQEGQKEPKSKYVSDEDAERFEQLKKRLKQKLRGQMNMGIDPEIFTLGVEMTYMIVKNQARKFAEYARAMIEEMGDAIRPYLKTFYNGARDLPELEDIAGELTPYEEVRAFDVANFDKEGAKDLIKTAEVVSKEDEADRQAEQAKEKITKSRNERLDREMEVKRTAAHFPMETPEESAAFDKRIPDMSDEELLAYMKEDGNGDTNKAFHTNLYDEYDYRHNQEESDAYDRYLQQLRESDTTSEQAEEMLGNLYRDMSQFATEDRPFLLGQEEALQDYISELRNESRSNETEGNSQTETDVLSLPQPIKDNPNYSKEEQESLMYRKGESMEEYGERNNKYPNNWESLYLTQKYSDRMDDIANILSSLSAENADEVGKAIADIVESRSEGYELLSLLRNIPVDAVLPYQDAVSAAFEAKESKDSGKSQPEQPTLQLTSEQEKQKKSRTTASSKNKIEDVGEKIGGARKDIVQATVDRININGETFSKIFPKFDYHKLIKEGLDPKLAAGLSHVAQIAKDEYKRRKRRLGEQRALSMARFYANYAKGYLLGDTSLDFSNEGWVFTEYGKNVIGFGIEAWERLYDALGEDMFDIDLSGFEVGYIMKQDNANIKNYYYRDGERIDARYGIKAGQTKYFTEDEKEEALQYLVDGVKKAISYKASHPFKLGAYYTPGVKDSGYIGAKIGGKVIQLTPKGEEYGLKYLDEHNAELQLLAQRKAEELKEERKNSKQIAQVVVISGQTSYKKKFAVKIGGKYVDLSDEMFSFETSDYSKKHLEEMQAKAQELLDEYNKEHGDGKGWKPEMNIGGQRKRVGKDWREGRDVSATELMNKFGFRGVEFGNYVTQKERQRLINECYDAFMDMADVLGVSPRALSLNGELGMAIGARGIGGAAAHYEPAKNVINLTKKNGWGALAHEWWHSLDYYFGQREKAKPATASYFKEGVRKEMKEAFEKVMDGIKGSDYLKRSRSLDRKTNKDYYSKDTELGARAFQDYIEKKLTERGQVNDFLSHFTTKEDWNGEREMYPYPIEEEGQKIGNAFESFFDTIQEREGENGNIVLYEPSATYGTRDGSTIVWRSLFDEYEMRGEVTPQPASDKKGKSDKDFNPTELHLRKLKKGETCHVERVYEETKQFDFTGKDKVESSEDVAYIFKQLENAAVENSFLVLVKDGKPTVIHLGVGSYVGVMAPFEQAIVAYQSLKPEQVYFVHNHPGGSLKASRQDQDLLNRIKRAFGEDVVEMGIIIDTTSGKYGEFGGIETAGETYSIVEEMPQSQGDEVPIKVYQFNRQVFAPNWNPETAFQVASSQSVAEFVSSHRLGEHKKMSFLVLNNQNKVVANVFLPWTKLSDIKRSMDAGDLLAGYVQQCGGVRGVLYGNYDYEPNDRAILAAVGGRMRQLNSPLMDVLHVEHSAYESGWVGVGEPRSNYDTSDVSSEPVLFRDSSTPIFYSNAARAVEQVRQEKATPEQWLKMIEKNGGLKSGEDKWIGLSDWLKESKAKSLTKQEVMDYILSNQIQIEETEYGDETDFTENYLEEKNPGWKDAFRFELDMDGEPYIVINNAEAAARIYNEKNPESKPIRVLEDGTIDDSDIINLQEWADNEASEANLAHSGRSINPTRLSYTTQGLENKREIALTVPTIESWNTQDEIHFGDAGQGRAVAWVRFGETTDADGNRVLVIDEIQSKRHQEGREKGYYNPDARRAYTKWVIERAQELGVPLKEYITSDKYKDEREGQKEALNNTSKGEVPSAPFEKNWHELAMKRMLRYAAENGYDKVAWTTGEQQAERYDIGNVVRSIDAGIDQEGNRVMLIHQREGGTIDITHDNEGNITSMNSIGQSTIGNAKNISDVVGKEIAKEALSVQGRGTENMKTWQGDGLRIGGEGMKGFYDKILPSFMNKYGKKWGVKVGTVELPNVEESARTMWSIDVTPEMVQSVMEGQPMFRIREDALNTSIRTAMQEDSDMKRSVASQLGDKLNTPLNIIEDVNDITHPNKKIQERQRRSKGWYDPVTGQVYVVLPNNRDVDDVKATIGHETVAHKGLRELVGEQRYNEFLDETYRHLRDDLKQEVDDAAGREFLNGLNNKRKTRSYEECRRIAVDELFGRMAEKPFEEFSEGERTLWQRIKDAVRKILDRFLGSLKLPDWFELGDNELRYILWRSKERLERGKESPIDFARDIVMREELGLGVLTREDTELSDIESKAKANGTWMKAPNGKPTNLTERQWLQVRTRAFKRWFGDWENNPEQASKVLDENGEPKVVYHGANNADFTEFYAGDGEKLAWFSSLRSHASIYAWYNKDLKERMEPFVSDDKLSPEGVYDVYLNIKNPINLGVLDATCESEDFGKLAEELGYTPEELIEATRSFFDKPFESLLDVPVFQVTNSVRFRKIIRDKGYDGATAMEYVTGRGYVKTYAVTEPNQIKSATDNNGEFNDANDDIRFRDSDDATPRALARDTYERLVLKGSEQFMESVQDSMRSLKNLYRAINEAEGKKKHIEDVEGYENAYLAENRMHSASQAQIDAWEHDFILPLVKTVNRMTGGSKSSYNDLIDYMMAKHGLERNRVLALRDFQKYQQENPKGTATLDDFRDKDYSGLTALTGESDVPTAESIAQTMVDDYEREHDLDITELWDRVNAATKSSLNKLFMSGMMSKERYEQIRDMFQYYIPLQGFDNKVAEDVYAYVGSDGTRMYGTPIRTAKGRKSKADDPLATIEMNGEAAIRQGNRNIMKQRFLNFVQNHPSDLVSVSDVWLRHNDVTDEWEQYFDADLKEDDTPDEVERKTREFEERMKQLAESDPDHYKRGRDLPDVPYRVLFPNDASQHQVLVRRNGKTFVLTINANPRAAQALNGLTNPDVFTEGAFGKIMNFGQSINRQLSALYTTRNPEFVASNFMRDAIYSNSMVWVKEGANYALNFHKNFGKMNPAFMAMLFEEWESGKLRRKVEAMPSGKVGQIDELRRQFYEFMINGGETGWTSIRDIEKHKRDLERAIRREGSTTRKAWKALGGMFDLANRSVENCARFAAYITSREMGRSIDRSIFDAKEISVNFNKKGAGDKFISAKGQTKLGWVGSAIGGIGRGWYVFFNASLQGLNNIARATGRHPFKAAGLVTTLFTLGSVIPILSALVGGDDDDDKDSYYNLPEYIRRSNVCFRWRNDMPWVTIPLPPEFRAIYGLGELSTGVITGKERYSNEELTRQFASQISQVLPLDFMEGGGGLHAFVPSQIKPLVEAYSNKSWTGLPIYRDNKFKPYAPQWTLAYSNASQQLVTATRWLNEATGGSDVTQGYIDWNPARIEYMLKGYLGGVFTMYDRLEKSAETILGQRDFEWRNVPVASRVLKKGDERTAARKARNEYFNLLKEYDKTKTDLNELRKIAESDREDALSYAKRIDYLHNSRAYTHYLIMDSYKPLFDAYYKMEKTADDIDRRLMQQEEDVSRRELIDLIHAVDDGKEVDIDARIMNMVKNMMGSEREEVSKAAMRAAKHHDENTANQ